MRLVKFVEFSRKIVGVGLNYASHIKEMKGAVGNTPATKPLLFLKPPTALVVEGNAIKIPRECSQLHHEVELGVIISRKGSDIKKEEAMNFVGGYTICLDMTARDLQQVAKEKGHPWAVGKGFDTSCPVGQFIPKEQVADPYNLRLWCQVNGQTRQDGTTKDMLTKIPDLLAYISSYFTLEPGDLILTGTPSGVSEVKHGDVIEAGLADLVKIKFEVVQKDKQSLRAVQ
ncbi:Acylpyruvase FAHD1, mitochondrial [Halotydeus destructor]|nr:Acylpyruvase FAHD1, mitochondrial [Halotydeus destructor]